MITNLRPTLASSTVIQLGNGSEWVTIRLHIDCKINLLATFVSAPSRSHATINYVCPLRRLLETYRD